VKLLEATVAVVVLGPESVSVGVTGFPTMIEMGLPRERPPEVFVTLRTCVESKFPVSVIADEALGASVPLEGDADRFAVVTRAQLTLPEPVLVTIAPEVGTSIAIEAGTPESVT
jgi:hypothetical protein